MNDTLRVNADEDWQRQVTPQSADTPRDYLLGLKENAIIGHQIPAGTRVLMVPTSSASVTPPEGFEPPPPPMEPALPAPSTMEMVHTLKE
jgi:hypothetical protein